MKFLVLMLISTLGVAAPIPSIFDGIVNIPVIQTSDGRLWEAKLVCDDTVKRCDVIKIKEICLPEQTRFSPDFCWEFSR